MPKRRDTGELKTHEFYAALNLTRIERCLTWKAVSEQAGVNLSTLSRIARGLKPDFDNGLKLMAWASLDPFAFTRRFEHNPAPLLPQFQSLQQFLATLRDDPHLTPEAATHLSDLISAAYRLAVGKG